MEHKKTKITDFIKYIEDNQLSSKRLLNKLKIYDGYFYDWDKEKYIEDITDFTDKLLRKIRNVGEKTLTEFNELRTIYLQYINPEIVDCDGETENNSKKCVELPREKYNCLLRSDISKTLRTIEDETNFVEVALLDKFEREGIELVKINQENEAT